MPPRTTQTFSMWTLREHFYANHSFSLRRQAGLLEGFVGHGLRPKPLLPPYSEGRALVFVCFCEILYIINKPIFSLVFLKRSAMQSKDPWMKFIAFPESRLPQLFRGGWGKIILKSINLLEIINSTQKIAWFLELFNFMLLILPYFQMCLHYKEKRLLVRRKKKNK